MNRYHRLVALVLVLSAFTTPAFAETTFICREPGGKRMIEISGNDIGPVNGKVQLRIDPEGYIDDRAGKHVLYVSSDDVRKTPGGVILARFDGEDIRQGDGGKVVLNYHGKDICPDSSSNRIFSIEGRDLSKQQLVAGMYLLKPDLFKLSNAEETAQRKAMAEANAEQEILAKADRVAGAYTMLNSYGPVEKLGEGSITFASKKGDAYPVNFDLSKGGGPTWTGVGCYREIQGDKCLWVAYGTPKTIALCVYEIDGGNLKGTWHPWYIDGTPKMTGKENLNGPAALDGVYKIDSAAAPATGEPYTGSVSIHPIAIVGSNDDAKPYSITWTFGESKIQGIGIKSGKYLFVASGTGADTLIAKYTIGNGTMNCDWYKLGSTEKGGAAAMKD